MIIGVREQDKAVKLQNGQTKIQKGRLLYWKWVNNGKPRLGGKKQAARFDGAVLESALRQVALLYPECEVTAMNEFLDLRKKKRKAVTP